MECNKTKCSFHGREPEEGEKESEDCEEYEVQADGVCRKHAAKLIVKEMKT